MRFDAGRLYAALRAGQERWGWPRRFAYVALGPLIPLVRYLRLRRELFAPGALQRESALGPALFAALAFDAAGQMLGYAAGAGNAAGRLARYELDRAAHLDDEDRARFATG
jgi:hypothetical protein